MMNWMTGKNLLLNVKTREKRDPKKRTAFLPLVLRLEMKNDIIYHAQSHQNCSKRNARD